MKTRLLRKLRAEARSSFKIVPCESNDKHYLIKTWCYDCYELIDKNLYTLEEAIKKIEKKREEKFYQLCNQALYERRCRRVANL